MATPGIGAPDDAFWLIEEGALARLRPYLEARLSDDSLTTMLKQQPSSDAQYTVSEGVASFSVLGPLLDKRSRMLDFFGVTHTSYDEIRNAVALANASPSVKRIEMYVDSPGGLVKGFFPTAQALETSKKPIKTIADSALSAAYGLAAATGNIEAAGPASTFGSVGVAASYFVSDRVVNITSSNAPDKMPDLSTEHGKAVVRQQLDDIHELFAGTIARGRDTDVGVVNRDFGRGRTLLTSEALNRRMIDGVRTVSTAPEPITKPAAGPPKRKQTTMDVSSFKVEHPEVYEKVMEAGRREERDRVLAHLTLADSSGDFSIAAEAIKDGSGVSDLVRAKHFASEMKRRDQTLRKQANVEASKALDDAAPGKDEIDPLVAADREFLEAFKRMEAERDGRTF